MSQTYSQPTPYVQLSPSQRIIKQIENPDTWTQLAYREISENGIYTLVDDRDEFPTFIPFNSMSWAELSKHVEELAKWNALNAYTPKEYFDESYMPF